MSYEERVEGKAHDGFPGEAWCVRADDAKRIAREADTEIAALRARAQATEADCAALRKAAEVARAVLSSRARTYWEQRAMTALEAALAAMTPDATLERKDLPNPPAGE